MLNLVCGSSLNSAKIASAYSRVLSVCLLIPITPSKGAAFWPSSSRTAGKRIKKLSNRISDKFQEKKIISDPSAAKTVKPSPKNTNPGTKNSKPSTKSPKLMFNYSFRNKKIKKYLLTNTPIGIITCQNRNELNRRFGSWRLSVSLRNKFLFEQGGNK
jgi:hypothetical protein